MTWTLFQTGVGGEGEGGQGRNFPTCKFLLMKSTGYSTSAHSMGEIPVIINHFIIFGTDSSAVLFFPVISNLFPHCGTQILCVYIYIKNMCVHTHSNTTTPITPCTSTKGFYVFWKFQHCYHTLPIKLSNIFLVYAWIFRWVMESLKDFSTFIKSVFIRVSITTPATCLEWSQFIFCWQE